jgi:hypothetical protein
MNNNIEQQTNLLTLPVSMIHDLKEEKNNDKQAQTGEKATSLPDINKSIISPGGDLTDCSYSEEEEAPDYPENERQLQPIKANDNIASNIPDHQSDI